MSKMIKAVRFSVLPAVCIRIMAGVEVKDKRIGYILDLDLIDRCRAFLEEKEIYTIRGIPVWTEKIENHNDYIIYLQPADAEKVKEWLMEQGVEEEK